MQKQNFIKEGGRPSSMVMYHDIMTITARQHWEYSAPGQNYKKNYYTSKELKR